MSILSFSPALNQPWSHLVALACVSPDQAHRCFDELQHRADEFLNAMQQNVLIVTSQRSHCCQQFDLLPSRVQLSVLNLIMAKLPSFQQAVLLRFTEPRLRDTQFFAPVKLALQQIHSCICSASGDFDSKSQDRQVYEFDRMVVRNVLTMLPVVAQLPTTPHSDYTASLLTTPSLFLSPSPNTAPTSVWKRSIKDIYSAEILDELLSKRIKPATESKDSPVVIKASAEVPTMVVVPDQPPPAKSIDWNPIARVFREDIIRSTSDGNVDATPALQSSASFLVDLIQPHDAFDAARVIVFNSAGSGPESDRISDEALSCFLSCALNVDSNVRFGTAILRGALLPILLLAEKNASRTLMSAMAHCAQVQSRALCDGVLLPLLQSAGSRSLNASQTDAVCRLIKDSSSAEISSDLPRRFLGGLLEAPLTLAASSTSSFDLWQVAAWLTNEAPKPILWDDKLLQIISAIVSSSGHATSGGSATSAGNTSQCLFTAPTMSLMIDRLEACVDALSSSPRLAQVVLALVSPHASHATLAAAHKRRWIQLALRMKSLVARAIAQHANAMPEL